MVGEVRLAVLAAVDLAAVKISVILETHDVGWYWCWYWFGGGGGRR